MHEDSLEHALIQRYFSDCGARRSDVCLGVGDDGAIVRMPAGKDLVTVVDTLVAGVHFDPRAPAGTVGHKALAVNLSDLAAMGAEPAWATLALSLPEIDEVWVAGFARGLDALANAHDVALVGGDTTRGPLTVTIQVQALLPQGQGLMRSGARPGDRLYVTGTPGDAALGLAIEQGESGVPDVHRDYLLQRLRQPEPRLAAGQRLLGLASAAIDISDGLLTDLGHLCRASRVGARLDVDALPRSPALDSVVDADRARSLALGGGDDYELLVALPEAREVDALAALAGLDCHFTRIGCLVEAPGVLCLDASGETVSVAAGGYRHFGGEAE